MIRLLYSTDPDYSVLLELRNWVLRMPLGMDIRNDDLSDEADCQFLAYYSENGQMTGCIKIKKIDSKTYQVQQMAVHQDYQVSGIGTTLLQEAEKLIKEQGGENVIIEAREYAIPFYRKNGYLEYGDEYKKINIPHRSMKKSI